MTSNGNGNGKPVSLETRIQQRAKVLLTIANLQAEEAELGAVIRASHVGSEAGDASEARHRRNEIRDDLRDLQDTLNELDAEMPRLREETHREAARLRLIAISRGEPSVRRQMEEDEAKAIEHAHAFVEAINRINERGDTLCTMREEVIALCDRFGLPAPELPLLGPIRPAAREGCIRARDIVRDAILSTRMPRIPARKETAAHGLHNRYTYSEVIAADTPAGEIIKQAGLKPWPALTPEEQAKVKAAEAERQADQSRINGELSRVAHLAVPRRGI